MGKFLRAFALFAAIAALMSSTAVTSTMAQVKDKEKEKDKKDVKPTTEEPGSTEVYMAKDGWRFRIKNPEGKTLAVGVIAFEKKEDCLKAVEVVKTAVSKGKVIEIKDEKK
jgi:uncharacterized protein YegP (UPF0339 family)